MVWDSDTAGVGTPTGSGTAGSPYEWTFDNLSTGNQTRSFNVTLKFNTTPPSSGIWSSRLSQDNLSERPDSEFTDSFGPLAVNLASFTAVKAGDHNTLAWETTSELHNLGFNVWRGTSAIAPTVKLNQYVIPSQAPGGTDWLCLQLQ